MSNSTSRCHICNYPISEENPICPYCGSQFLDLSDEISMSDYFKFRSCEDILIYRSGNIKNLYLEIKVNEELFHKFNEMHLIYRKFDRLNDLYTEISHTLKFELRFIRIVKLSEKDIPIEAKDLLQIGDWEVKCLSTIGQQQIDSLCAQFSGFSFQQLLPCYETIGHSVLREYGMLYLNRFTIATEPPKCV